MLCPAFALMALCTWAGMDKLVQSLITWYDLMLHGFWASFGIQVVLQSFELCWAHYPSAVWSLLHKDANQRAQRVTLECYVVWSWCNAGAGLINCIFILSSLHTYTFLILLKWDSLANRICFQSSSVQCWHILAHPTYLASFPLLRIGLEIH